MNRRDQAMPTWAVWLIMLLAYLVFRLAAWKFGWL